MQQDTTGAQLSQSEEQPQFPSSYQNVSQGTDSSSARELLARFIENLPTALFPQFQHNHEYRPPAL